MRKFATLTLCIDEMFPSSKEKTVRQQPNRVQAEYIEVPDSTTERVVNLTVASDVMFVNGIPFVVSASRGVNFTMVGYLAKG